MGKSRVGKRPLSGMPRYWRMNSSLWAVVLPAWSIIVCNALDTDSNNNVPSSDSRRNNYHHLHRSEKQQRPKKRHQLEATRQGDGDILEDESYWNDENDDNVDELRSSHYEDSRFDYKAKMAANPQSTPMQNIKAQPPQIPTYRFNTLPSRNEKKHNQSDEDRRRIIEERKLQQQQQQAAYEEWNEQQQQESKSQSHQPTTEQEAEFMKWCEETLGIYTILEIQSFEYVDYMNMGADLDLEDDLVDPNDNSSQQSTQNLISVRGLAASRDIEEGEVVIRIPLDALWSVTTTIDKDPVLGGNVMGPEARFRHGWEFRAAASSVFTDEEVDDDDEDNEPVTVEETGEEIDPQLYEMPLLAVALLYHVQLGDKSSMAPYVDILKSFPVDSMPILWSAEKLRSSPIATEGVRTVARGIRDDMREMYDTVVQVLIDQHPSIFGKDAACRNGGEWMYSYEKFKWAFAIINSRHWSLPIEELEGAADKNNADTNPANAPAAEASLIESLVGTSADEAIPPAATPTEHWVQEHVDIDEETHSSDQQNMRRDTEFPKGSWNKKVSHSFLAPVADLLNFGPPCTRGRYNKDSHTFEIVASCSFQKGQEVTFWYSSECDHVIIGVYGFSHPLVPVCPTSEELRIQNEALDERLAEMYAELMRVEKELDRVEDILSGCDCCRYGGRTHSSKVSSLSRQQQEAPSVRGSRRRSGRDGNPSVRRMYSTKSEF